MNVTARASAMQAHRQYYDDNGYVVIPGLLSHHLIDTVLSLYRRDILNSSSKFYRQNTNVYDRNRHTSYGHVIQSFLDVHNYKSFPEFRQATLDLYFSQELQQALSDVTGHERHNLMQSMLFDANAATPPHQDWWYLDTVPNGNLLAAWIALEDIEEDAGRFYVIPKTQNTVLHEPNLPHSMWLERVRDFKDRNPDRVHAPALKKGDVLFWNSRTIHGSMETRDLKYSRKSLTAHFMPSGMTFGNLFTAKPWARYEKYGEHNYFANQPEYSAKAALVSKVKVAIYDSPRLMHLVRKIQRRSVADT
jgi:phytanoyl-CoA hydroxylase